MNYFSLIFHHGQHNKIALFGRIRKLLSVPLTTPYERKSCEVKNRLILLFSSWPVLRQDLLLFLDSPLGPM